MADNKQITSPSLSELESIHSILKDASVNKLSDRDVMIPITTKAFIEGRLMPTTTSSSTEVKTDSKEQEQEQEQVIVKLGKEYLAEMSLDDACAYIERRMKDLRPLANKDSATSSTKEKTSFKMKKGFLNNKDTKKSKQKKLEEEKNLVEDTFRVSSRHTEPILPFMDILEEYDESGNQVKAEALDVSKQLIDFQRKMKGYYQNDETKESFDSDTESVGENSLTNTDFVDDDIDFNTAVPTKQQSYEEISARLDKLALLEAEEEIKKQHNMKSSRKLQGKGWSKGFLSSNTSKTSHENHKKTHATNVIVPSDAEKVPSNPTVNKTDTNISQDDRERKVQFSNNNQVKTIPRIGTKSIQSVMGSTRQSQESDSVLRPQDIEEIAMKNVVMSPSTETITSNKGTKPVSIGGVVERQNVTSERNTTSEDTEPKKLSRFAQRRQQMR